MHYNFISALPACCSSVSICYALPQVMSIPQLHQLAGQIKTLRRIREQRKAMQNKQGSFRPSAASAPWGVDLNRGNIFEGASKAQDSAAKQIKQPSKKAPRTPKIKPPAKRARCCTLDCCHCYSCGRLDNTPHDLMSPDCCWLRNISHCLCNVLALKTCTACHPHWARQLHRARFERNWA